MSDSAASSVAVGDIVAEATYELTRDSLVRYAGASGDFNPIHYRDDIATSVGLPGVLAHGMLTMGIAVQPVVDWAGDSGRITDYQVRFTRPVLVDPVDGRDRLGGGEGRHDRRRRHPGGSHRHVRRPDRARQSAGSRQLWLTWRAR